MKTFYAIMKQGSPFIKGPFDTFNEAIKTCRLILEETPMHKLIVLKTVGEMDANVTTNFRNWVKKF